MTVSYCSFCGKDQHEVKTIIAGPSVLICDECVGLCNDIIRDKMTVEIKTSPSILELEKAARALCQRRGRDPDERVGYDCGSDLYMTQERWREVADELRTHHELQETLTDFGFFK